MDIRVVVKESNGSTVSVLEPIGMSVGGKKNTANSISFSVPRNSIKIGDLAIGRLVELYRDGALVGSGKIITRSMDEEQAEIQALTQESLLEAHWIPGNYGLVYEGVDIAVIAKDLCKRWYTLRASDLDDFNDRLVLRGNVDTDTLPGRVIIGKDGTGAYKSSGSIVLRFDSHEVPDFVSWDRIRWASDYSNNLYSTMQFRHGNSVGEVTGAVFEPSTTFDSRNDDAGQTLTGERGVYPDKVGFPINAITDRYIEVRINLYTDDTVSDDPSGNPVGFSPVLYGLEVIARTTGLVDSSSLPATIGKVGRGVKVESEGSSALTVLSDLCNKNNLYFKVIDGSLFLSTSSGSDKTNSILLRV